MDFELDPREEAFLVESNAIELIFDPIKDRERKAFDTFLKLKQITVCDMVTLVQAFQPNAVLRDRIGLNVRVGNHYPPKGSSRIKKDLQLLLDDVNTFDSYKNTNPLFPYWTHHKYETLHPFTDGNGRSGRMLWWKMRGGSHRGFRDMWYFESLMAGR